MNNYNTFIFDFDYTLADSSTGIIYCFRNVLDKHGYNDISDEKIKRTIGMTLQNSFCALMGETDIDKLSAYVKEYVNIADSYMNDNTVLFPETAEVLTTLKENGFKLAIVSTKYRYRIKYFLDREFGPDFIEVIIGGEDVANHKPSPEGLLLAIDKLNSDKKRCLYIGDSTIDAETAQAAEVDFYGVLNGATTKEELSRYPNIMIAKNLNNLLAISNQTVNI